MLVTEEGEVVGAIRASNAVRQVFDTVRLDIEGKASWEFYNCEMFLFKRLSMLW